MRVFVTGGTGFVGRHLVDRLIHAGHQVTLMCRTVPPAGAARSENVRYTKGDLTSITDLGDSLGGHDCVVHLAAKAHGKDPGADFGSINRDATLQLAERAAAFGVGRFVFVSSIGVNGTQNTRPFTEADPPNPSQPYAVSKHEAELGLASLAKRHGQQLLIVRPPLVYGPGAPGNMRRLIKLVQLGLPLPFGNKDALKSFIAVENLADFLNRCVEEADVEGTYLPADNEVMSVADIVRTMGDALGLKPILFPVPRPLLAAASGVPGLQRIAAQLFSPLTVDNGLSRATVKWSPRLTTPDAIAAMTRSFARQPW